MSATHENLNEPLLAMLVICVIASSFLSLDVEGSLFWGGAAIPHVCAFALLGPAPAAVLTVVEEISVWAVDRYRARMFPINLFSTVAPNMLAGYAMQLADGAGPWYYVILAAVAASAIALNFFVVTALVGLFYGEPILERYKRHRQLAVPLAINLAAAVGAVALYRAAGVGATFFVVGGVLAFAYVIKRLAVEREHLGHISELAESRGRLVAQLLETEDRERRALADVLHDDVIQRLLVLRQDLAGAEPEPDAAAILDIDEVVRALRGTIRATHPSVLDRVGLPTAIATVAEFYAARGGFEIDVAVQAHGAPSRDRLIFSAARELLANAAKHAEARHVALKTWSDGGSLWLTVADDGRGFDSAFALSRLNEGHIGLASLRDRASALGGRFLISTVPGGGTTAELRLPLLPASHSAGEPGRPLLASVSQH